MNVIKGKQAILSVYLDSTWSPVLCAVGVKFYFDHEEIMISSRNSGKHAERMTRMMSWGFEVSGLTKADDTDGQKSFFWLAQASVRGSTQRMRIRFTDDDGNSQDVYGDVLIRQGAIDSVVGGFSVASHVFPGTGEPTIGVTIPGTPTNIFKLYLDTTEGAFEVSHANLGGLIDIKLVEREDGGYKEVVGVPNGRQFQYTDNITSGKLTFDSTIPFNAGEIVYIMYEK
ncbi:MAG: hypothetical protein ACT4OJ_10820 [Bacteroidota bacterium]